MKGMSQALDTRPRSTPASPSFKPRRRRPARLPQQRGSRPMSDRPIIFSAPMVRALIEGRKTQTRRILKDAPEAGFYCDPCSTGLRWVAEGAAPSMPCRLPSRIGDRLWVREACGRRAASFLGVEATNGVESAFYIADDEDVLNEAEFNLCPWWRGRGMCSPIHMPRWASRITLIVTDVRVQRLQEISEEDAKAEGVYFVEPTAEDHEWHREWCAEQGHEAVPSDMQGVWMAPGTRQGWGRTKEQRNREQWGPTAAFAYRCTWNSIHGPDAWAANPWVCALTFRPILANI